MALVRLAGAVGGTVAKSLLAPRPGAALVPDPLRPLPRPASPDRLAKVLARRLSPSHASYAALPAHERLAAVDSVRDTFAAAGDIGAERLFALDLDPARLHGELRSPAAGLGERARGLYDELLGLCCAHLVEQLTAHPSFPARAAVEQTRATGRTRELVADVRERMGPRADAVALGFEERYAAYVTATHGRLELFGLTLGRSSRELPLDTAYISLAMSGEREIPGLPRVGPATLTTEQALAGADRLLLRGAAGSGKSTLVQWLAVTAARRGFLPELADLNRCVPFVLRLRAFTVSEALPLPEDFLRAAGVPLTPAGPWAESLLTEGRALVLVDGVDEVPTRLRARTEAWLKSLVAAFPRARYVVTTRPSAVPVDWLSGLGFVAHSLLPMERDALGSFVSHWHDAARLECGADDERARLDTYEKSLMHAVTTRRDLGRLATNPLMCALLCALNRDRRMQLPRARKELYDAALEMLLVRRDTEREIQDVEGVTLTRDEQTALLQRLAYWLIRNGQVEAVRDEAVEMVGEWLAAMPQVACEAEHVFQHLLNRSGLLREPVPGAVDFVHRTFQDYLGAKAAVEARDFGVLVSNAHDDQWDDVVRMAVGHARLDERARLLKQLLRRADRAPRLRNRLVLLAATCLEHAPELDPGVRGEVERRTEELVPPRGDRDAEELAKVGELVIELLPGPEGLDKRTAAAVVRTAGLIKGDAALAVISRFREDVRPWIVNDLCRAWGSFDTESYAKAILSGRGWKECFLTVRTPEQLLALRHVPQARHVRVVGNHPDLTPLLALEELNRLQLWDNGVLTDLSVLTALPHLTDVHLNRCLAVRDLTALARPGITDLILSDLHHEIALDPLSEMPDLQHVLFDYPLLMESVGELQIGPQLIRLSLSTQTRYLDLSGIERWPHLTDLTLSGVTQTRQLAETPSLNRLRLLNLRHQDSLDLRHLSHLLELETLVLFECEVPDGLAPLGTLPALTTLWLINYSQPGSPMDLSPLVDLEHLTIRLSGDTPVTGEDLFPPGRIIRDPD